MPVRSHDPLRASLLESVRGLIEAMTAGQDTLSHDLRRRLVVSEHDVQVLLARAVPPAMLRHALLADILRDDDSTDALLERLDLPPEVEEAVFTEARRRLAQGHLGHTRLLGRLAAMGRLRVPQARLLMRDWARSGPERRGALRESLAQMPSLPLELYARLCEGLVVAEQVGMSRQQQLVPGMAALLAHPAATVDQWRDWAEGLPERPRNVQADFWAAVAQHPELGARPAWAARALEGLVAARHAEGALRLLARADVPAAVWPVEPLTLALRWGLDPTPPRCPGDSRTPRGSSRPFPRAFWTTCPARPGRPGSAPPIATSGCAPRPPSAAARAPRPASCPRAMPCQLRPRRCPRLRLAVPPPADPAPGRLRRRPTPAAPQDPRRASPAAPTGPPPAVSGQAGDGGSPALRVRTLGAPPLGRAAVGVRSRAETSRAATRSWRPGWASKAALRARRSGRARGAPASR